ncbi:hypothetical protein FIBSPDRAFT_200081 [Athelia psychrophila]|uniref:Uncharacterized protein n=1 Tax=Athelia psychrophila TaxID=1759441 RepID=A0A165ZNR5_9AGAM|nr:hypothetical protein FIBSPDRAFT_200081 [Fibularhizoctonia sp. CBS 109695]
MKGGGVRAGGGWKRRGMARLCARSLKTFADVWVSLPDLQNGKGHVSVHWRGIDKETERTISTDILQKRQAQMFERREHRKEGSEGGEGRAFDAAHVERGQLRASVAICEPFEQFLRLRAFAGRRIAHIEGQAAQALWHCHCSCAFGRLVCVAQARRDHDVAQREPLKRGEARHEPAEVVRVRERRAVDSEGGQRREHARQRRGRVRAQHRPFQIAQLHGAQVGERGAAREEHVRGRGVLEGQVGRMRRDGAADLLPIMRRRVEEREECGGGARGERDDGEEVRAGGGCPGDGGEGEGGEVVGGAAGGGGGEVCGDEGLELCGEGGHGVGGCGPMRGVLLSSYMNTANTADLGARV